MRCTTRCASCCSRTELPRATIDVSSLQNNSPVAAGRATAIGLLAEVCWSCTVGLMRSVAEPLAAVGGPAMLRSEEHTSELQSPRNLRYRHLLQNTWPYGY